MNVKSIATIATSLSLLAGAPAIAGAEVLPTGPISVTHATLSPAHDGSAGPNYLHLAFENHDDVPATKVVFEVRGGWYPQRIVDVGTFAPGVAIERAFLDYSGAPERDVDVVQVDFSDGTSWNRDDTGLELL